MSVTEFSNRLGNAILSFLWRQWTSLGITGQFSSFSGHYVLDPEALLLFSSWFCRYDPRLFDLIIDWLHGNGEYISIQRLKAIAAKTTALNVPSLGYMASCLSDRKERRWQKFADDMRPATVPSPLPLFLNFEGTPCDFIRHPDDNAQKYGFLRNPYIPSFKTTFFSPTEDAAFLLQLRGAFGLSARAETILSLLSKEICKIQDIADISSFSWKSIQDAIQELCSSSLVTSHAGIKRGSTYSLAHPEQLLALFGKKAVSFPNWPAIFEALAQIWQTVSNPRLASLSPATTHGEIVQLFKEKLGDSLLAANYLPLKFLTPDNFTQLPDFLAKE